MSGDIIIFILLECLTLQFKNNKYFLALWQEIKINIQQRNLVKFQLV